MLSNLLGPNTVIELDLTDDDSTAFIDPGRFDQILTNLALNADDAMPDGGTLTIATTLVDIARTPNTRTPSAPQLPPGTYVRLTATDTGSGIAPRDIARIFDPYFTTKPPGHGTGLGLATTYGTIHQSGGAIVVDSEPGTGTTFTIWFPHHPCNANSAARTTAGLVLIVEDDADVRDVLVTELEQRGYTTHVAGDGAAGNGPHRCPDRCPPLRRASPRHHRPGDREPIPNPPPRTRNRLHVRRNAATAPRGASRRGNVPPETIHRRRTGHNHRTSPTINMSPSESSTDETAAVDDLNISGADTPRLSPLSDLDDGEAWAMVEASPDGMILTDEHGVLVVVNSRVEALFGYDRGDLLGRTVEELIPQRHRLVHTAHRTRYRAKPNVRAMGTGLELMARRSDGSEFRVEVSLSPVTTASGLRVVATVRDITERVAIEAHTHAVLHTIDAAHDGVFMFTAGTLNFKYVNRGAVGQLGYSHDELLTMTPLHITPEFTETAFRALLAPLLDQSVSSHTFSTVHRRKDGRDVPVEIRLEYPLAAGPGQPRLMVALVRDITERLAAERAIREHEATVRMLEDRERLARDLHDLVIQRLFAAGMGLQSIHPLIDNEQVSQRVEQTVTELDQTINELRAAIFHITTPPSATITAALDDIIQRAAHRLGFEPTFTISGDIDSVPTRIVEPLIPALTEILSNVARHAHATRVDISIKAEDERVVLSVADNGIGFDPTAARGNGLRNLADRARQHGGHASFTTDSDGTGTVVTWTAACSERPPAM